MQPLAPAVLAALTPRTVEVRFYDDRVETIPFDERTDLVAISVETYTARRSYEIATEYRRRRVPVVMGGFHATLCPHEVAHYAEAVVVGEAEEAWPRVVDDALSGRLQKLYRQDTRPALGGVLPERRIFRGKHYLPLTLVEAARGCQCCCEFCAIQSMFRQTHNRRPLDSLLSELSGLRHAQQTVFFVDDNLTANIAQAKELFRTLIPLRLRWLGQATVLAAHDEECLALMRQSGCNGVLIGFESLDARNLDAMHKSFNTSLGDYVTAIANLRRHGIGVFGTFVFGYDQDTPASFAPTVRFAQENGLYLAAFNHLVPFPGTPLYARLVKQGRLLSETWWLDSGYRFNQIAFRPTNLTPDELRRGCMDSRLAFYSADNIWRRSQVLMRWFEIASLQRYLAINLMHRFDVRRRDDHPLGDETWTGELLPAS
jgi:radical SAM superfamily enzyme YgiQ (UPF0313 family)